MYGLYYNIVPSAHYLTRKAVFIDKHYVETMWRKKNAEKRYVETMWKSKTPSLGNLGFWQNMKKQEFDHLVQMLII